MASATDAVKLLPLPLLLPQWLCRYALVAAEPDNVPTCSAAPAVSSAAGPAAGANTHGCCSRY